MRDVSSLEPENYEINGSESADGGVQLSIIHPDTEHAEEDSTYRSGRLIQPAYLKSSLYYTHQHFFDRIFSNKFFFFFRKVKRNYFN